MFDILKEEKIKKLLIEFDGYLVGGYVRDSILGIKSKDIDISSLYEPYEIECKLIELGYTYKHHGKAYGVYVVKLDDNLEVELSAARRDLECDGRQATVEFIDNIKLDLARRDFTINAMAVSVDGNLIDPFNGQKDLTNRVIRFVGEAEDRVNEDNLRVWRAIRFAYKFKASIASPTDVVIINYINKFFSKPLITDYLMLPRVRPCIDISAIDNRSDFISRVSNERIRTEIEYILSFLTTDQKLWYLFTGLLQTTDLPIYRTYGLAQPPEFHDLDVYSHIHHVTSLVPSILDLKLAALLHDIGKPYVADFKEDGTPIFRKHDMAGYGIAEIWLRKMTFSNDIINKVLPLIQYHMYIIKDTKAAKLKFLNQKLGNKELFKLWFLLRAADILGKKEKIRFDYLVEHIDIVKNTLNLNEEQPLQLAVNGFDIMETFSLKPGPQVGKLLQRVRELVYENPANNTKEFLLSQLSFNDLE